MRKAGLERNRGPGGCFACDWRLGAGFFAAVALMMEQVGFCIPTQSEQYVRAKVVFRLAHPNRQPFGMPPDPRLRQDDQMGRTPNPQRANQNATPPPHLAQCEASLEENESLTDEKAQSWTGP